MHERFYRGTPAEVFEELSANPNAEKGEFTLTVEMDPAAFEKEEPAQTAESALCDCMIRNGCTAKEAIAILAASNSPFRKNELKEAALKLKACFGGKEE